MQCFHQMCNFRFDPKSLSLNEKNKTARTRLINENIDQH